MRIRFTTLVLLAVLTLVLVASTAAFAGGSTSAIIKDASNGALDGRWSAAQVQTALAYLKSNPTYSQYSDAQGVLEDYLNSLGAPGAASIGGSGSGNGSGGGQLMFTGANTVLIFGAGLALIAGGLLFRRRSRA